MLYLIPCGQYYSPRSLPIPLTQGAVQVTPPLYSGEECQLAGVPLPTGLSAAGDTSQPFKCMKPLKILESLSMSTAPSVLTVDRGQPSKKLPSKRLCLTKVCLCAAASPLQLDTTQGTGMHNLTFQAPDTFTVEVASLAAWPIAQSLTSDATGPIVSFNSTLAQIGGSATATIREFSFLYAFMADFAVWLLAHSLCLGLCCLMVART